MSSEKTYIFTLKVKAENERIAWDRLDSYIMEVIQHELTLRNAFAIEEKMEKL